MAHRHGKLVLMHSDGYILNILDDLVEIGVDAVNSQLQCMKLADLERFRGKLTDSICCRLVPRKRIGRQCSP